MTNRKKNEFQLIAVYQEQNDINGRDDDIDTIKNNSLSMHPKKIGNYEIVRQL